VLAALIQRTERKTVRQTDGRT